MQHSLPQNVLERVWEPASRPDLSRAILPEAGLAIARDDSSLRALAVYLNAETPTPIFAHLIAGSPAVGAMGRRDSFRQHWHQHAPECFGDVLFLIDTYRMGVVQSGRRPAEAAFRSHAFSPLTVVDELLHDSRGVLLWHHQLENLYRLFDERASKATDFRKGINAKRAQSFETGEQMHFEASWSLSEVIQNRMVFGVTNYPSLRAARNLYNAVVRESE